MMHKLSPKEDISLTTSETSYQKIQKYVPQVPNKAQTLDLVPWLNILDVVGEKGIYINNMTFTSPTVTTYSNACEKGMGGYNTEGLVWRYTIPPKMVGLYSINLLEFLAAAITIHLTLRYTTTPQKILTFTDCSRALG